MHLDNHKTTTSEKSKKSFSRVSKAILGTVLLMGIGGTAMAQNMVIRSTGPSSTAYPAGKKLTNTAKITLTNQDSVTILTKGGTRVLKGPGTFSAASGKAQATGATTRLASFISNRGSGRARTGAVRSAGVTAVEVAPTNPNLWYLDVRKGGKFCVADADRVVLWRPDYTGSATASIIEPINGGVTQVIWGQGNPLKAWPREAAPITSGASYRVLASNTPNAVAVDFVVLSTNPDDVDQTAEVLIENGCQGQLDLLVEKLEGESSSSNTDQG